MSIDVPETDATDIETAATHTGKKVAYRPLRIWPALLLLVGLVVSRSLLHLFPDGPPILYLATGFGPMLCGALLVLWWLVLSRARVSERIVGVIGVVAALGLTVALIDASMRGPAVMVLTIPMGFTAFAIGAIACSRVLSFRRTWIVILMAACGFGVSALLRSDGIWGNFAFGLHWRWAPTPDERMLAERGDKSAVGLSHVATEDVDAWLANPEWPEFRGADRISRQRGSVLSSDWSTSPPEPIWKIPVGPGWSSFSVAGNLLFTQEQRLNQETTICYEADTGREVWTQTIESRFDDPMGGPGPRATPTLADGRLFVMGASGHLLQLDPRTGDVVWQTNLQDAADREPPMWGFCSSPLVVDSRVIVHAGGKGDKGTLAFDAETGDLVWSAAAGDHTYSSPQLCVVEDESLVLILTNTGLNLLNPSTGAERMNYEWKHEGYRALQPQIVDGDSILLPTGTGSGTRRIRVSKEGDALKAEEVWTSRDLKPDFNDFVVYGDCAYGFDGAVFTCVDLKTGKRNWKGGRYGKGQVLLLEDSEMLLVAGESGDVILLKADPEEHSELARFQAIEGRTWNHPVVIGDRLYIRNSQEAACYRLPLVTSDTL